MILSVVPLLGIGVWSWIRDHTSFVGRLLLLGIVACLFWALSLILLVQSGASAAFRATWLPSVTLTAAAIYMLAKVATAPTWRPKPWLLGVIAAECIASALLTLTNDHHHAMTKDLHSGHLEYAWGFGVHTMLCFLLLGLAAVEMSRRTTDPVPWIRRFSRMIMLLVILTCTVQVLQIRLSQTCATIALIAWSFATHRGGLGHRDPALAQAFDPTDPVTGMLSRRSIEQLLDDASAQDRSQCQLLVIDIDRFKGVNDKFGHLAGDHVLATVAARLCAQEPRLTLGRWGGDEFVGLLRGVTSWEMTDISEDLAAACSASRIPIADGRRIAISVSIGSAPCDTEEWRVWVAAADAAMYADKERSRDRTMPYDRRL